MPESAIPPLAAADQYETVKEVKEIYFDFLALNRSLFSLAIKAPERLLHVGLDEPVETRIIDGVVAALLATQRNPCIRFRATSAACKSIATSVVVRTHAHRIPSYAPRSASMAIAARGRALPPKRVLCSFCLTDATTASRRC